MFLSESEYHHVLSIMDRKVNKSPLLADLMNWSKDKLNLIIYDYICDQTTNGLTRLRIVVWDYETQRSLNDGLNLNARIQKKFQKQFSLLSRKYNMHPDYQNEDDIFVCYETICDEIQKRILRKVSNQIKNLKKDDIWKIEIIFESIHFFYETDEQIDRHHSDGTSNQLKQQCEKIVRDYDKYSVFQQGVSCVFTSHQTLDEQYNGSMFYYTR